MSQISISFDPKTEERIRKNAQISDMTVASYVRKLVDIGLRVEEMSAHSEGGQPDENSILAELKKLACRSLTANFETLYLQRYLLTQLPEEKAGTHNEMLDKAKLKAQSYVDGLLRTNH